MRYFLLAALLLVSLPLSAARIMIVGDSLSDAYNMPREDGWVSLLEEELGADAEIINASISGETTAGGAARIEGLMETHSPDLVLVELGGNDGLRGLPPAQLRGNLETILQTIRRHGAHPLLMQIRLPPNLGRAYIGRFESLFPALAKQHEATLVPFFLEDIYERPGMLMGDGIHPTIDAQPYMMRTVLPHIEEAMERVHSGE